MEERLRQTDDNREYRNQVAFIWLKDTQWKRILSETTEYENYVSVENYERNILPELIREIPGEELYLRNQETNERRIDTIIREDIARFRNRLIERASAMYYADNTRMMERMELSAEETVYVSRLLPLIIAKANPQKVNYLRENEQVQEINIVQNDRLYNEFDEVVKQTALKDVKESPFYSMHGIKGRNVRIGLIEAPPKKEETYDFDHGEVVKYELVGAKITENHVTYEGIVPAAHVKDTLVKDRASFLEHVEELILQQYYLINMSAGFSYAEKCEECYDFDKQIEQLIYKYRILFVKSAGNEDYVTAPGNAMNSIVVGNIETKELLHGAVVTKRVNYCMRSKSGHIQPDRTPFNKPDISAPGTYLYIPKVSVPYADKTYPTGTSFAAPLVTAALAQLSEEFPKYQLNFLLMKGILLFNADGRGIKGDAPISDNIYIREQSGFGMLNAETIFRNMPYIKYKEFSYDLSKANANLAFDLGRIRRGSICKAILLFDNHTIEDGMSDNDLDLYLYDENGVSVASSVAYHNYEMIHFQIGHTCHYNFVVKPYHLNTTKESTMLNAVLLWTIQ